MAFSRKQIIEPKIIDLNELVDQTQRALINLIGENIDLKVIPGANLWMVKFDPSQIEQILINLAVNARDAMLNGGVHFLQKPFRLEDLARKVREIIAAD